MRVAKCAALRVWGASSELPHGALARRAVLTRGAPLDPRLPGHALCGAAPPRALTGPDPDGSLLASPTWTQRAARRALMLVPAPTGQGGAPQGRPRRRTHLVMPAADRAQKHRPAAARAPGSSGSSMRLWARRRQRHPRRCGRTAGAARKSAAAARAVPRPLTRSPHMLSGLSLLKITFNFLWSCHTPHPARPSRSRDESAIDRRMGRG